MSEECVHFRGGHFEGVFLVVKEDEPFDPVSVSFGGSGAQVAEGCGGGNLVEEFGWRHCYAAAAQSSTPRGRAMCTYSIHNS
jgi:hypothetical protein